MLRSLFKVSIIAASMLLPTLSGGVHAQAIPDRTITLIVPYAAGGPIDVTARLLAERVKVGAPFPGAKPAYMLTEGELEDDELMTQVIAAVLRDRVAKVRKKAKASKPSKPAKKKAARRKP